MYINLTFELFDYLEATPFRMVSIFQHHALHATGLVWCLRGVGGGVCVCVCVRGGVLWSYVESWKKLQDYHAGQLRTKEMHLGW